MQPFTETPQEWNTVIASLPNPHLLQTWEWAQVKTKYGWQPLPMLWYSTQSTVNDDPSPVAAAMILKRVVPAGGFARRMSVLYVPKGPLMDWDNTALRARVLDDLQTFAKRQGAIFVKIDPDVVLGTGIPGSEDAVENKVGQTTISELARRRWLFSSDQIQYRNSVLIDLTLSEDEMLVRMKQKTRYNVRLAEKKGVTMRIGKLGDLPLLYRLYAETSVRDGFVIRNEAYYRTVWETFMRSKEPTAEPLIAEVDNQPVAAIFLFFFSGRAYYLYGMSHDAHRDWMPNYLLQWNAMRRAKMAGCTTYDLWGAPDKFDESDSMWGVFRFKEGLGGRVVRSLGAWDYPASPLLYKLYTQTIPRVLDIMGARVKMRTRQTIGG